MPRTPDQEHDQLKVLARTRGLPEPPERPGERECCNRGCEPCVWDYYERALSRWRERHASAHALAHTFAHTSARA